jgi:hypothetical protein
MAVIRRELAASIPFFAFAAGALGTAFAGLCGGVRAWRAIGGRLQTSRRAGWVIATILESVMLAGVTVFMLMFPIMALAAIWQDFTH